MIIYIDDQDLVRFSRNDETRELNVFVDWDWLYSEFHQSFEFKLRQQETLGRFLKSLKPEIKGYTIDLESRHKVSRDMEAVKSELETHESEISSINNQIASLNEQKENSRDKYIKLIEDEVEKTLTKPDVISSLEVLQEKYKEELNRIQNEIEVVNEERIKQQRVYNEIYADKYDKYYQIKSDLKEINKVIELDSNLYEREYLLKLKKDYQEQLRKVEAPDEDLKNEQIKKVQQKRAELDNKDELLKEKQDDLNGKISSIKCYLADLYQPEMTLLLDVLKLDDLKDEFVFLRKEYPADDKLKAYLKERRKIEIAQMEKFEEEIRQLAIDDQRKSLEEKLRKLKEKRRELRVKERKLFDETIIDFNTNESREYSKYVIENHTKVDPNFSNLGKLMRGVTDQFKLGKAPNIEHFFNTIHHIFEVLAKSVLNEGETNKQVMVEVKLPDLEQYDSLGLFAVQRNDDEEAKRWSHFQRFMQQLVGDYISDIEVFLSSNTHYLSAVRSGQKRLYKQIIPKTEVSHWISQYVENHLGFSEKHRAFLEKWLKNFGIGEGIEVDSPEGIMSALYIKIRGARRNIADFGFGYTQLLAIIINILLIDLKDENQNQKRNTEKYKLLLIEEPEANLHPNLQSKLTDLFIDAYEQFGIHFIIETHSEYLIRKLQVCISECILELANVNLYYIYPVDEVPEGKKQVEKLEMKDDGELIGEFGTGFFDESERLLAERQERVQRRRISELEEEISQYKMPVIVTEGKTDVTILEHAWKALNPNQKMPFKCLPADNTTDNKGGSGGHQTLKSLIETVRPESKIHIGLFDHDDAIKSYKSIKNSKEELFVEHAVRVYQNKRGFAMLLPFPAHLKHLADAKNLSIEMLFDESDYRKEVNGKGLKIKKGVIVTRNPKTNRIIEESESDSPEDYEIGGDKVWFAEKVVPTFNRSSFKNFQRVFDVITEVIAKYDNR